MADDLRYPKGQLNSGKFRSDYILFSIFEYAGSAVTIADTGAAVTARKGAPKGTIALPIQSSISDQNNVDWQEDKLDFIKLTGAALGLEFMTTGGVKKSGSQISDAIKKATGYAEGGEGGQTAAGKAVSTALLEGALGANLRSRFSGEVMNPNLELLFNGPTLRTFSFSFFMSARSPEEATEIKKIINAFKKNMAPKTTKSLFLKSPNIFEIKYMNGNGQVHKSLNKIKICALQSCSVNYTPAGTYSTFGDTDNTMTAYSMTLQFGELDPIYDKDYDTHPIGY
jgi:hypothetical protein